MILKKVLLIASFFLFTLCSFAESSKKDKINIGEIKNLSLSGYENNKNSALLWMLNADYANAIKDLKNNTSDISKKSWELNKLNLQIFDTGKKFAEIKSSSATFNPKTHSAESTALIEVRSDSFFISGNGWLWKNENSVHLITILDNTHVLLFPNNNRTDPKRDLSETISISSKSLEIKNTENETILTFKEKVFVKQHNISTACEHLEVHLPAQKTNIGTNFSSNKNVNAIKTIICKDDVVLTRENQKIWGETAEFIPSENKFFVYKNVRFHDSNGELTILGDTAFGEIKKITKDGEENKIIIQSDKNQTPSSLTNQKLVRIEMPGFTPSNRHSKTIITSEELIITVLKNENIVSISKNVTLSCDEIKINCEKANIRSKRQNGFAFEQKKHDINEVKQIIAEGNIKAFYDNKELFCEKAILTPKQNTIELYGHPKVIDKKNDSILSGYFVKMSTENKNIEVFSSPKETTPQERVAINLKSDKNNYEILGDKMTITQTSTKGSVVELNGNILLKSTEISATCEFIILHTEAKKQTNKQEIKSIIARENIVIKTKEMTAISNLATITPNVNIIETEVDPDIKTASSKHNSYHIEMRSEKTGSETNIRPRIYFSETANSQFNFALQKTPINNKKEKAYIEADEMELLSETSQFRFWVQGNCVLQSSEGARGFCNEIEGLLLPDKNNEYQIEKIFVRKNIRITHNDTIAKGNLIELYPQKDIAYLKENAEITNSNGTKLKPGNDCFTIDLKNQEIKTGVKSDENSNTDKKLQRPKITISSKEF